MYLVGQAYRDTEKGELRVGRVRAMPDDKIFTVMVRSKTVCWDYGIYKVREVMERDGHPFRVVTPCKAISRRTFEALTKIQEAQEYGDGQALWAIHNTLKMFSNPKKKATVCDLLQVACMLLVSNQGQSATVKAVESCEDLVS